MDITAKKWKRFLDKHSGSEDRYDCKICEESGTFFMMTRHIENDHGLGISSECEHDAWRDQMEFESSFFND